MAQWRNEIEAAVHAVVNDVSAVESALIVKVALELVIDVCNNGVETVRENTQNLKTV